MFSFRRSKLSITQSSFSRKRGLEIQTLIISRTKTLENEKLHTQATLEKWLQPARKPLFQQHKSGQNPLETQSAETQQANSWLNWDDTISCIELTMKRGKRGYLKDWMKGAPRGDSWDGSIDNQEKSLEEHVSKYGWEF